MTMLEHSSWIRRALTFLDSLSRFSINVTCSSTVRPVMSMTQVSDLSKKLRVKIPDPIVRFLSEASAGFDFEYRCSFEESNLALIQGVFPFRQEPELFGGGSLCDASLFEELQDASIGWASGMDSMSIDKLLWQRSFPFFPLNTGDALGLDVLENSQDPPVVYLAHDGYGQSSVVFESFDHFLKAWEKVHYIYPDLVVFLTPFRDPKTGIVDIDSPKIELLRKLFEN